MFRTKQMVQTERIKELNTKCPSSRLQKFHLGRPSLSRQELLPLYVLIENYIIPNSMQTWEPSQFHNGNAHTTCLRLPWRRGSYDSCLSCPFHLSCRANIAQCWLGVWIFKLKALKFYTFEKDSRTFIKSKRDIKFLYLQSCTVCPS